MNLTIKFFVSKYHCNVLTKKNLESIFIYVRQYFNSVLSTAATKQQYPRPLCVFSSNIFVLLGVAIMLHSFKILD
jgi:hypothetical protein